MSICDNAREMIILLILMLPHFIKQKYCHFLLSADLSVWITFILVVHLVVQSLTYLNVCKFVNIFSMQHISFDFIAYPCTCIYAPIFLMSSVLTSIFSL